MTATALNPSLVELFTPKLVAVLHEHYGLRDLRADAVASGVTPGRGLYTAIVGGFFASLLGGTRFRIGGPAGSFRSQLSPAS